MRHFFGYIANYVYKITENIGNISISVRAAGDREIHLDSTALPRCGLIQELFDKTIHRFYIDIISKWILFLHRGYYYGLIRS